MKALTKTDFHFDGQKSVYHGKVRDVYNINDDLMVMVATDRISAFDVILPKGIPFKGQVLNQDRKSTRLNSSHANISYAVFCLKKKTKALDLEHVYRNSTL